MKILDSLSLRTFYRVLFLTIGGTFLLGQFGRFELASARAVYFQDILLTVFCLCFILHKGVGEIVKIISTRLGFLFIALNLWICFTSLLNFHDDSTQLFTVGLYLIRLNSILLMGSILSDLVHTKILGRDELHKWLIVVVTGIATLGFVQYFLYPDTRGLRLLGWDDHYYRLISTIFDPGFTGIIIVIGMVVVLVRILNQESGSKNQGMILHSCFLLLFPALLLTYSRASYLAFAVSIIFVSWKLRKYFLLLLLPVFVVCILLLPRPGGEGVKLERTASVVSRIDSVQDSFSQFSALDALIGKGWYWKKQAHATSVVENVTVANHSSAAENSYVFVFTSLGVIGVLLCVGIIYVILDSSHWNSELLTVFLSVGVHALFTNTFFYSFVLLLLTVLMVKSEPEYLVKSR